MSYKTVRVGTVDVDSAFSPHGYVILYYTGFSREKWKHFFVSHAEFNCFWQLWHKLEKPYELQLSKGKNKNTWKENKR